jgi:hypothetical protein
MPVYRHFYGYFMNAQELIDAEVNKDDIESISLSSDSISITNNNGETIKFVNYNKQSVRVISDSIFSELRSYLILNWFK